MLFLCLIWIITLSNNTLFTAQSEAATHLTRMTAGPEAEQLARVLAEEGAKVMPWATYHLEQALGRGAEPPPDILHKHLVKVDPQLVQEATGMIPAHEKQPQLVLDPDMQASMQQYKAHFPQVTASRAQQPTMSPAELTQWQVKESLPKHLQNAFDTHYQQLLEQNPELFKKFQQLIQTSLQLEHLRQTDDSRELWKGTPNHVALQRVQQSFHQNMQLLEEELSQIAAPQEATAVPHEESLQLVASKPIEEAISTAVQVAKSAQSPLMENFFKQHEASLQALQQTQSSTQSLQKTIANLVTNSDVTSNPTMLEKAKQAQKLIQQTQDNINKVFNDPTITPQQAETLLKSAQQLPDEITKLIKEIRELRPTKPKPKAPQKQGWGDWLRGKQPETEEDDLFSTLSTSLIQLTQESEALQTLTTSQAYTEALTKMQQFKTVTKSTGMFKQATHMTPQMLQGMQAEVGTIPSHMLGMTHKPPTLLLEAPKPQPETLQQPTKPIRTPQDLKRSEALEKKLQEKQQKTTAKRTSLQEEAMKKAETEKEAKELKQQQVREKKDEHSKALQQKIEKSSRELQEKQAESARRLQEKQSESARRLQEKLDAQRAKLQKAAERRDAIRQQRATRHQQATKDTTPATLDTPSAKTPQLSPAKGKATAPLPKQPTGIIRFQPSTGPAADPVTMVKDLFPQEQATKPTVTATEATRTRHTSDVSTAKPVRLHKPGDKLRPSLDLTPTHTPSEQISTQIKLTEQAVKTMQEQMTKEAEDFEVFQQQLKQEAQKAQLKTTQRQAIDTVIKKQAQLKDQLMTKQQQFLQQTSVKPAELQAQLQEIDALSKQWQAQQEALQKTIRESTELEQSPLEQTALQRNQEFSDLIETMKTNLNQLETIRANAAAKRLQTTFKDLVQKSKLQKAQKQAIEKIIQRQANRRTAIERAQQEFEQLVQQKQLTLQQIKTHQELLESETKAWRAMQDQIAQTIQQSNLNTALQRTMAQELAGRTEAFNDFIEPLKQATIQQESIIRTAEREEMVKEFQDSQRTDLTDTAVDTMTKEAQTHEAMLTKLQQQMKTEAQNAQLKTTQRQAIEQKIQKQDELMQKLEQLQSLRQTSLNARQLKRQLQEINNIAKEWTTQQQALQKTIDESKALEQSQFRQEALEKDQQFNDLVEMMKSNLERLQHEATAQQLTKLQGIAKTADLATQTQAFNKLLESSTLKQTQKQAIEKIIQRQADKRTAIEKEQEQFEQIVQQKQLTLQEIKAQQELLESQAKAWQAMQDQIAQTIQKSNLNTALQRTMAQELAGRTEAFNDFIEPLKVFTVRQEEVTRSAEQAKHVAEREDMVKEFQGSQRTDLTDTAMKTMQQEILKEAAEFEEFQKKLEQEAQKAQLKTAQRKAIDTAIEQQAQLKDQLMTKQQQFLQQTSLRPRQLKAQLQEIDTLSKQWQALQKTIQESTELIEQATELQQTALQRSKEFSDLTETMKKQLQELQQQTSAQQLTKLQGIAKTADLQSLQQKFNNLTDLVQQSRLQTAQKQQVIQFMRQQEVYRNAIIAEQEQFMQIARAAKQMSAQTIQARQQAFEELLKQKTDAWKIEQQQIIDVINTAQLQATNREALRQLAIHRAQEFNNFIEGFKTKLMETEELLRISKETEEGVSRENLQELALQLHTTAQQQAIEGASHQQTEVQAKLLKQQQKFMKLSDITPEQFRAQQKALDTLQQQFAAQQQTLLQRIVNATTLSTADQRQLKEAAVSQAQQFDQLVTKMKANVDRLEKLQAIAQNANKELARKAFKSIAEKNQLQKQEEAVRKLQQRFRDRLAAKQALLLKDTAANKIKDAFKRFKHKKGQDQLQAQAKKAKDLPKQQNELVKRTAKGELDSLYMRSAQAIGAQRLIKDAFDRVNKEHQENLSAQGEETQKSLQQETNQLRHARKHLMHSGYMHHHHPSKKKKKKDDDRQSEEEEDNTAEELMELVEALELLQEAVFQTHIVTDKSSLQVLGEDDFDAKDHDTVDLTDADESIAREQARRSKQHVGSERLLELSDNLSDVRHAQKELTDKHKK